MRLVGKRVERLNRYGDDLCIELKEKGMWENTIMFVTADNGGAIYNITDIDFDDY